MLIRETVKRNFSIINFRGCLVRKCGQSRYVNEGKTTRGNYIRLIGACNYKMLFIICVITRFRKKCVTYICNWIQNASLQFVCLCFSIHIKIINTRLRTDISSRNNFNFKRRNIPERILILIIVPVDSRWLLEEILMLIRNWNSGYYDWNAIIILLI